MSDKGWKAAERRVAKALGGQRIPVTGERHGSDVDHPLFCVQVKVRKMLPSWLWTWLGGIVATAQRSQRVGILVLRQPRQRDREGLVVMRFGDFQDWFGIVNLPRECSWCGCDLTDAHACRTPDNVLVCGECAKQVTR